MKKVLFPSLILALVFSGCNLASKKNSSDIEQSKIETVYSFTYTGESDNVDAAATFNHDDEKEGLIQYQLDGKSSVTFNGKKMKPESVPIVGGVFHSVDKLPFREENTFVYTDNNGKVYTNTFSVKPVSIGTVRNDADAMYIELSRPMADNEAMWLFLEGDTAIESQRVDIQTEDSTANGYYNTEDHTIRFIPDFKTDLEFSKTIKAVLNFETYHEKIAQVPAAGGKIVVTYRLKAFEISRPE